MPSGIERVAVPPPHRGRENPVLRRLWGLLDTIREGTDLSLENPDEPATWFRVLSEPIEKAREVGKYRQQAYVKHGGPSVSGWQFRSITEVNADGAEFKSILACYDPRLIEPEKAARWAAKKAEWAARSYANRRARASATQEPIAQGEAS